MKLSHTRTPIAATLVEAGPPRWVMLLTGSVEARLEYVVDPKSDKPEMLLLNGSCIAWRELPKFTSRWHIEIPAEGRELRAVVFTKSGLRSEFDWISFLGPSRALGSEPPMNAFLAGAPDGIVELWIERKCVFEWRNHRGTLPIPDCGASFDGESLPRTAEPDDPSPATDPRPAGRA